MTYAIASLIVFVSLTIPPSLQRALNERPNSMASVWFFSEKVTPSDIYRAELMGARTRTVSSWLNSVSMLVPPDEVHRVASILHADRAEPVATMRTESDEQYPIPDNFPLYDSTYYGSSLSQLATINAIPMHKNGFIGSNIIIGVFDTGFDSTHPSLRHLWTGNRIVAEYDFASGDHLGSPNGMIPVVEQDMIDYINSLDVDTGDSTIAVVYSIATENDLSAYPYVKNKWRIAATIGHIIAGHAEWLVLPFTVQDSFATYPSAVYQNGMLYIAYQAKDVSRDFDIKFVKIDTLGTVRIGPLTIASGGAPDIAPEILAKGDTVWISWFSSPSSFVLARSLDGGLTFTEIHSFDIGNGDIAGNVGVMFENSPMFLLSHNDTIYIFRDDTLVQTAISGTLPDAVVQNDTVHFIFVSGDTISYCTYSADGELSSPQIITTEFGGIKPGIAMCHGSVSVVYSTKSGQLLSKRVSDGEIDTLSSAITDFAASGGDFIAWRQRGDSNVYPENYIPHSGGAKYHGTKVLSVIAGFYPGTLIGVAPGARFILARTEKTVTTGGNNFENQVEEDFWIEALEWASSHGVNIVSSSLGYADWYRRSDMDGHTAPISRAASKALDHNILVVNAMGNVRHASFPEPVAGDTTLVAPADADGIIAVGAYETDSTTGELLPPAGALGPTADGRIKPEVIAPYWCFTGADQYLGNDTTFVTWFLYSAGTSYGTALVSGGAALIWDAHPDWTAEMVRDSILQYAKPIPVPGYPNAPIPNNIVGWGLIDVAAAARVGETGKDLSRKDMILTPYPSPARYGEPVTVRFNLFHASDIALFVYDLAGNLLWEYESTSRTIGYNEILWDGRDKNGNPLPPGLYIMAMRTNNSVSTVKFAVK